MLLELTILGAINNLVSSKKSSTKTSDTRAKNQAAYQTEMRKRDLEAKKAWQKELSDAVYEDIKRRKK